MERKHLTIETATSFFAILFRGEHHIPGTIKEFGFGFCVNSRYASLATYDYDYLTKLVIMAHKYCVRAEIMPSGPGMLKICIWQRQGEEGSMSVSHPSIETAIDTHSYLPEYL